MKCSKPVDGECTVGFGVKGGKQVYKIKRKRVVHEITQKMKCSRLVELGLGVGGGG